MKTKKRLPLLILFFCLSSVSYSQSIENVVIVIIDGARYTETFGDPDRTHIPEMNQIASEGLIYDDFFNNGATYTSRAVPALWCGAWTNVYDTVYQGNYTQYTELPSIFEYYRKQLQADPEDCYYVLKYIESLWLPSFHSDYGPQYWPATHSVGESDEDVLNEARLIMEQHHPRFLWVYFADVDHAGHSGDWEYYISSIEIADEAVGILWDDIQTNEFYKDKTALIVSNDHGRHDDEHGGFQGHGCGCEGCRHILFLAAGPGIRENEVLTGYRTIPDLAVTAAYMMDVNMEYASGNVMEEIFIPNISAPLEKESKHTLTVFPNPFTEQCTLSYFVHESSDVKISIFDTKGKMISSTMIKNQKQGKQTYRINNRAQEKFISAGVYFGIIQMEEQIKSFKLFYSDK